MPQFAFIMSYGPNAPEIPDAIPMSVGVRYVDTDTNALVEFDVAFSVATGSNASQIQSAAADAVRTFGATRGFDNLGSNAVISGALTRG